MAAIGWSLMGFVLGFCIGVAIGFFIWVDDDGE